MLVALKAVTESSACADVFFADVLTNPVQIKGSLGGLYLLNLMNGAAATSYLHVWFQPLNSVVFGTTKPDLVFKLPTNAGSGFTQTIPFPVPVGGRIPANGSLGAGKGLGTGLTVAGCSSPTATTSTAAIGVTAIYL